MNRNFAQINFWETSLKVPLSNKVLTMEILIHVYHLCSGYKDFRENANLKLCLIVNVCIFLLHQWNVFFTKILRFKLYIFRRFSSLFPIHRRCDWKEKKPCRINCCQCADYIAGVISDCLVTLLHVYFFIHVMRYL